MMSPSTRFLVHLAFFYTCIEGLVVNILYPAKLPFIYKDLIILLAYVAILLPDPGRLLNPSPLARGLNAALALFVGLVLLYLLVPTPVTMLSELVAVKQRLYYIPLLIVAYYFIRSVEDFRYLATAMAVYAIGVSLFGVYLFFAGPTGLQRIGATYAWVFYTPSPGSLSTWRVPGTFTSPGQYGAFLMFNTLVVAALVSDRGCGRWPRAIGVVSLLMVLLAMLTSGTRATLVLATGGVALAFLLSGRLTRLMAWAVTLYATLSYGFVVFGPGVADRVGSIVSNENLQRFQRTYFGQLFLSSLLERPMGSGLGVATIGARHFSEFSQVVLMESYFGVIAVEIGWAGVVAFFIVCAAILLLVLKSRPQTATSPEATYWLFLAAYVVLTVVTLPVNTAIDNAPTNFYFWFSIGALIRLAELELWRQWEARAGDRPDALAGDAGELPATAP